MNGEGTLELLQKGDIYRGNFIDNKLKGEGEIIYYDGSSYKG